MAMRWLVVLAHSLWFMVVVLEVVVGVIGSVGFLNNVICRMHYSPLHWGPRAVLLGHFGDLVLCLFCPLAYIMYS